MSSIQAIILAAGRSRRFNTATSKLRSTLCGQEMVLYPLQACEQLAIPQVCVIGHQREEIKQLIQDRGFRSATFVEQLSQKGTGHALVCTQPVWCGETLLVMNGDMPLITKTLLQELIAHHAKQQAAVTFATALAPDGGAYGRVVTSPHGYAIIEARDCTEQQLRESHINAGIYLFQRSFLDAHLHQLAPHDSGEYYITDLIALATNNNLRVSTYCVPFDLVRGVNTLEEHAQAESIKRKQIISYWMNHGVQFMLPETVHVDGSVSIGAETSIGAGVIITNDSHIGAGCTIESYSIIQDSTIHDHVTVKSHSVISESEIHQQAVVGPYAHIRNKSTINAHAVVGNFVEVNKTTLGQHSKAKHLTYLGMATIGTHTNIGAGTITCNYDGFAKHDTVIQDNVFIGSNSALIAPVTIGNEAMVAAGSIITENVPSQGFAIARERQVTKLNYAPKLREKLQKPTQSFTAAHKADESSDNA